MKFLLILPTFCVGRWISRSVEFDDFATATWTYDVDFAENAESPIKFEIVTEQKQFSFGWNRYDIIFYYDLLWPIPYGDLRFQICSFNNDFFHTLHVQLT